MRRSGVRSQESGVRGQWREVPRRRHHSPLTTHHSPARRSAVTLLEVLFAIMVAAVGLLGAIAVFPVALSQARKGRQADATAVGADAAVAKVDAELMRRPDRWLRWNKNTMPPQTQFLPIDFSQASATNTIPQGGLFGRAFCIDPMGFAHNQDEDPNGNGQWADLWNWFPAVPEGTMGNPNAAPYGSRMLRLTLYNNDPTAGLTTAQKALRPMSYLQAEKVFRIEDELMFERPADNTLPAAQLFTKMLDASGNQVPGRRQEEGRLTWFATLVPKLDRLNTQIGEEYVLSIVVCLNRSGEATHVPDPGVTPRDQPLNEWTATVLGANGVNSNGDFHSSGIGGGEVTLSTMDPNVETGLDQFYYKAEAIEVRTGSWVMLGRTLTGANGPIQYFQWYRISDVEENARHVDVDSDGNNDRYQRDATLIGPDWPADLDGNNVSEPCDVTIMPHVVHVYERTIKIDTGAQ